MFEDLIMSFLMDQIRYVHSRGPFLVYFYDPKKTNYSTLKCMLDDLIMSFLMDQKRYLTRFEWGGVPNAHTYVRDVSTFVEVREVHTVRRRTYD